LLDQVEECFVNGQSGSGSRLLGEVGSIVARNDAQIHFLISIREDYLSKLDILGEAPRTSVRVGNLDLVATRDAIVRPLYQSNLQRNQQQQYDPMTIDDDLIAALMDGFEIPETSASLADEGGASNGTATQVPAFLQLIMRRIWNEERRQGSSVLRARTLDEIGGLQHVVEHYTEERLDCLSRSNKRAAARMFRLIITPDNERVSFTPGRVADVAGLDSARLLCLMEKLVNPERILS